MEESEANRLRNLMKTFPQGRQSDDYRAWVAEVGVFDARGLTGPEKEQLEAQLRLAMTVLGANPYPEKPKHNK